MKRPVHLDLSGYLPYLVNRFGAALVQWFSENALSERHLSIAMWRVLAALSNDDCQRMTDLSRRTSIEISTLSRLVTRLVSMGLLERTRKETNSREVVVRLSPKGHSVAAELIPIAHELEKAAVAGIPKRELASVKRLLQVMHQNLSVRMRGRNASRPSAQRRAARTRKG